MKSNTWSGYYIYGLGYGPPEFGEKVLTEMVIHVNENGFEGQTKEFGSPYAVDQIGHVTGFTDANLVSFVKTYPSQNKTAEDGPIQSDGHQFEIRFTGEYEEDCMFGTWEIEQEYIQENERFVTVFQGLWKLNRVKSE